MPELVDQSVRSIIHALNKSKPITRKTVYCGGCKHPITDMDFKIEVNGSCEHKLLNPYGLRFHVMCFSDALGCIEQGDLVNADTWFPSYHWRFAMCGNCDKHLGWYYLDDSARSFYGLIGAQLVEQRPLGKDH